MLRGIQWTSPTWGEFEGEGVHLQIGVHGEPEVTSVGVSVHGFGDFSRYLARLCAENDWVAFDDASEGLLQNREVSF